MNPASALIPILPAFPALIGRLVNAQARHLLAWAQCNRTAIILAEMRQEHREALAAAKGPKQVAREAENAIRACLTAEENRRRTAAQARAMWAHQRYVGHDLAVKATKLTKIMPDMAYTVRATSQRPTILTNAECLPILAEMVATAESMTEQELRWIPEARDLIGADPKDLLSWPCVKRAKGAARGAGTGRPRKVRPGSVEDMVRMAFTSAPLAPGLRENGVDGRVGNLPVKVEGCTCAGYGFNGSVTCAGHGFAVRPEQDYRHPAAKGHRVDSYLDGRYASVRKV